jgi:hypothetical protein
VSSGSLGSTLTSIFTNSFSVMILCVPLFVLYNRKCAASRG